MVNNLKKLRCLPYRGQKIQRIQQSYFSRNTCFTFFANFFPALLPEMAPIGANPPQFLDWGEESPLLWRNFSAQARAGPG